MIAEYDFSDKLTRSRERADADLKVLAYIFPQASDIRVGSVAEDKAGADYIVPVLNREYRVDVKARERGCSRYWAVDDRGFRIPELAIELVSVHGAKAGWANDWTKQTDLVLFTFHPDDHPRCYIVPALDIRMFVSRYEDVLRQKFKVATQSSRSWTSECVFVPLPQFQEGVTASWRCRYAQDHQDAWYQVARKSPTLLFGGKRVGT